MSLWSIIVFTAELNGVPLYEVEGERFLDGPEDEEEPVNEREAVDFLLPGQNLHRHFEDVNGEDLSYDEPLRPDNLGDLDGLDGLDEEDEENEEPDYYVDDDNGDTIFHTPPWLIFN